MRKDKKKIFLFVRSPAASHASLMAKNFFLAFKNVKKKGINHERMIYAFLYLFFRENFANSVG